MVPIHEHGLLVVTDLDGTLLDATTYAFSAAREALDALEAAAIPLIIATSKTLPEVREIAAAIGGRPILIVENGGAVVIPRAYGLQADGERLEADALVVELGVAREWLVRELAAIAAETGASLRGFSQLSPPELASLTGLSRHTARLAGERRYDEPFLVAQEHHVRAVESRRSSAASRSHEAAGSTT